MLYQDIGFKFQNFKLVLFSVGVDLEEVRFVFFSSGFLVVFRCRFGRGKGGWRENRLL